MIKKAKGIVPSDAAPKTLEVLALASEMYPFIKTGGLADVVGALPFAIASLSTPEQPVAVTTLLPGYFQVLSELTEPALVLSLPTFFGGQARLLRGQARGVDLFVLDAPHLFSRAGNPYTDASGNDWQDNPDRFAALALVGAMIGWGDVAGYLPDIIHAHDWQAALVSSYAHYLGAGRHRPKMVLTIHNLAFQGQFSAKTFARLGLPDAAFNLDGVEYYGCVGYLKAGILFSDAITTVSPTYASEICSPQGGMGLDGLLRVRAEAVSGIVNGIDTEIWNPTTDAELAQKFDVNTIEQRQVNKRAVESHFNLPHSDAPLFCIVSRLTWQKGVDLVTDIIDEVVAQNTRIVVLGTGDKALEAALYATVGKHPTHVGVHIGYNESISHLMQAGCDAILVPSRFEPCGLTQLYGLRYGCVPIVAKVGGLADTVIDANDAALTAGVATGIQFHDVSKEGLKAAVQKAVRLYHKPQVWRSIQAAGMQSNVAWERSARQYIEIYKSL